MNIPPVLSILGSKGKQPPLPESFLFGVGTSDHQFEAYEPQCEDIRDVWERKRSLTARGRATDFQQYYKEDVERARELGCTAFRFSIAWSRVEPTPGQFDDAEFDYYGQLIATIRAAGMEPIVTLHHFTWPVHVEQRGGMIADDFPAIYVRYVTEVAGRFGREVQYWITFNEPSQLVLGYIKPWWEANYFVPPGLDESAGLDEQIAAVGKLMRNLFLAHTEAREVIKRINANAQVGSNPLLLGLPAWLQRWVDRNARRAKSYDQWSRQVRRFVKGRQFERGEVDMVIATLTQTPDRERQVNFSEVYFVAGQRLLVKKSGPATGVGDLEGKTIAVVRGSTAERSLPTLIPSAHVLGLKDYPSALHALDQGQADALLADDTILRGLMEFDPDKYKFVGEQLTNEPYAVALTQGHRELYDVVDRAIQQFKVSGEWAASCARHLDRQIPAMPPVTVRSLSSGSFRETEAADHPIPLARKGTALRRIQDRGYLIAGVKQDVPGFSYRDPQTGAYSGLEIDLARAVARSIFGDANKVKFRPAATQERIPLLRSLLRFLVAPLKAYSIASTALASNWWHMGMAGQLPEFLCPQSCVGKQDYVGIDYYWGIRSLRLDRIQRLLDAAMGRFDQAPVWPGVLYGLLRYEASLFPKLPILIIENGSVDLADNLSRAEYISRHVREVQRAVRDGVRVIGYFCWSITSNREWGLKFGKGSDFGLYHIELDTDNNLERHPTDAVAKYQKIIANRGVPASEQ